MLEDPSNNHEYLGIEGLASFNAAAVKLLFGEDSKALKEQRVSKPYQILIFLLNILFSYS
jgi:aspartate/tyrosine/aromatic aminotransferase